MPIHWEHIGRQRGPHELTAAPTVIAFTPEHQFFLTHHLKKVFH